MNPVAIGVEFGFGERFVKGNAMSFAKFACFCPGVTFDSQAFKSAVKGKMSKKGMSKFMKKEEAEILVRFEIKNRFWRAKEEFATGFKGKVWVGRLEIIEKSKVLF